MIDYSQARRQPPRPDMNINTPVPDGGEPPRNVMQPAPQPMRMQIRDLIQRVRGQIPTQIAPAPMPEQQPPLRSVLRPER